MIGYTSKFKYILILSALNLIKGHSSDYVKDFKFDLFNKTTDELDTILTTELYGLEKIYKHLNITKLR